MAASGQSAPIEEGAISGRRPVDHQPTLDACLEGAASQLPQQAAVGAVIASLARAAIALADVIAAGPLADIPDQVSGVNPDGDRQTGIDVAADRLMRAALRNAPVAAVLSEEAELPETLDPDAPLCVAIDPLDGSANLDNNMSVGTIFSIRPRSRDVLSSFFEPGVAQCGAGFFIYGPQISLVLALNGSVDMFILDRRIGQFVLIRRGVRVPSDTPEFAINASNRRHWNGAVRALSLIHI